MSTERETETACLAKLGERARSLMTANPSLSRDAAFARSCQELPRTTNQLLHAVAVLGTRGIKSSPIWE
jgi:hypothetical protein